MPRRPQLTDLALSRATSCEAAAGSSAAGFQLSCMLDARSGSLHVSSSPASGRSSGGSAGWKQEAHLVLAASISRAGPLLLIPGVRTAFTAARDLAAGLLQRAAWVLAAAGLMRCGASGACAAATIDRPAPSHAQDAGQRVHTCCAMDTMLCLCVWLPPLQL